ncbi:arabinan endo-1,5-alpha-L-arabinosidase [Paraliobacillus quinghaiensis]|uniref:Endo-alpha-(1->5)-L-arabinanase n=1 Tax=Paraliobacillus quinghaiensis TaxID=470815 RepID=A0A917TW93_9BACI|nr:family 43 glycosylhydrolase [Paraliobacillus quinghaiensis]GGM38650.1 arabinan endo-1,5-alpha-L-arabinosidase [Paraliobacillus quinghaiensis]
MKKIFLFLFITTLFVITACGDSEVNETTFQNPVYEPVLADPSIIKADDGYYYAYGTEDAWGEHSKAVFTPIIKSKNLIDWEYVGPAFEAKPNWKGAGSLWAPDIQKYQDKYYLYYSLSIWGDSNPGIGVALSDNPEGPFEDQGKLFTSEEIGVANSIDPFFYLTEDGIPYLFWGSFHGIYGIELAEDGLSTKGEKFQIAGDAFEAPYIIKREDYYYFFGSLGSCCDGANSTYHVAVGRSDNLLGPYLDKNGKDIKNSTGTTILQGQEDGLYVGPGHNAIVQDDEGTDWLIYHAINKEDSKLWTGASRRPVMIDPIVWEDGWPKVKDQQPNTEDQPAPVINQ